MNRLGPALARRLDRAARRAHLRHRYAHHPLCGSYAAERIHVGRHHLCRGCVMAGAGAVAGLALGRLAPSLPAAGLVPVSVMGAGLGVLSLARRVSLPGKLASRALPAAVAGFVVAQGLVGGGPAGFGAAATTVVLVAVGILLYRRRGPWREPCRTCPEREVAPCSGFRLAWRRERAFRRLAGRWLAAAGTGRGTSPPAEVAEARR